jgi:Uma2 family endonuclease
MAVLSADEYLNSSYRPDMESVDGVLVERGDPTIAHGLLQTILGAHFHAYRKQFRFVALSNVRTQIIARARYRIPDIMLCPLPLPDGRVLITVPWAVVEILSPDDKTARVLGRFRDFKQIGVPCVVLLDPERLVAYRFEDGSLLRTEFKSLDLPTGSLPFDSAALFQQLVEELNQGRG